MDQCLKRKAGELYQTAAIIAETYGIDLYQNQTSLVTAKDQIDLLSQMDNTTIWIINPSGIIVLDSSTPINIDSPAVIEGFDPTATSGSYYSLGNFYGCFEQEQLTVSVPITSGYTVHGYIIIHYETSLLQTESNNFLNIDYLMVGVILLLSLI
ncbi:MAG: two-component sensor histidine kinase, partial [Lachnospiraceae bacterium]|nr:two-component sensor histidine kinase [Lachnospiraceae bacterium]